MIVHRTGTGRLTQEGSRLPEERCPAGKANTGKQGSRLIHRHIVVAEEPGAVPVVTGERMRTKPNGAN